MNVDNPGLGRHWEDFSFFFNRLLCHLTHRKKSPVIYQFSQRLPCVWFHARKEEKIPSSVKIVLHLHLSQTSGGLNLSLMGATGPIYRTLKGNYLELLWSLFSIFGQIYLGHFLKLQLYL